MISQSQKFCYKKVDDATCSFESTLLIYLKSGSLPRMHLRIPHLLWNGACSVKPGAFNLNERSSFASNYERQVV